MEGERKITIAVTEPQIHTDSAISYVTYYVVGADLKSPFAVRRRFRDFHLLREKLVERWPGLYVPPIASKKVAVILASFRVIPKTGSWSPGKNSCITFARRLLNGLTSSVPMCFNSFWGEPGISKNLPKNSKQSNTKNWVKYMRKISQSWPKKHPPQNFSSRLKLTTTSCARLKRNWRS